jgi:hypothetical protein
MGRLGVALALTAAIASISAGGSPSAARPARVGRQTEAPMSTKLENEYAVYEIGGNGRNQRLVDKRTGADYCAHDAPTPFAQVRQAGAYFAASSVSRRGDLLNVKFGESGATASVRATAHKRYFTLEVVSVSGRNLQELAFANVTLTLRGAPEEEFACCALALNLKTGVPDLPRAGARLRATCYPRFGFVGSKVALIACPREDLREIMQEVVSAAPELPHSPIGGPWALGPEINRGSYLFNFGNLSAETVSGWIAVADALGFNQIDFHGGNSFRFGDFRPNPETYPHGYPSLKAVIDKLHAAGIAAGLHTYSYYIAKDCPYVTPVPDHRLAKDAVFTLAAPLTAQDTTVPVVEETVGMSAITGFFVQNSVTIQIDDELIIYADVSKQLPYAFTGCTRGAYGTRIEAHAQGAPVHHLKEQFGLFVPDPDSTLFTQIAAKTAEIYNECGFDMIYFDALDGSSVLAGSENAWHYGSKFVFEVWKRLKRPALMEMSTFSHHLWYVRSRLGAWDHPSRSYKRFIDVHCKANEANRLMFLPSQLGWWAIKTWSGPQVEPTLPDDIEYLCGKALGTDTGLSLMGVDPDNIRQAPALPRLAAIFKSYEDLRHANYFPESIKARLRVPGDEFTLEQTPEGQWRFRPVQYAKHRVEGLDGWSNAWRIANRFAPQPAQLRIQALYSAGAYDAPANLTLTDFSDTAAFAGRAAQAGVTAELVSSAAQVKTGAVSGCFTAESAREERRSSWASAVLTFPAPLDLSEHQALGVWVCGDGQGEVLNLQLRSPRHLVAGIGDHYVIVDFTGWRYFELIEPEGERYENYGWPYEGGYAIYRESVDYRAVASLGLWYNNLPAGKPVTCCLSPVKALPLITTKLRNPAVTIGGKTIVFPTAIETGCYLEFRSMDDCKLYGRDGALLAEVQPQGETPELAAGDNDVSFNCDAPGPGVPVPNLRAYVTVISRGEPLSE